MAPETAAFNNTFDNEWPLLCDVRAFVAQYCKALRAAENLILEYARKGHFKSYQFHAPTGPTQRGIPPTLWGGANPKLGACVAVDFANSTVTWMRGEPGSYTSALLIDEKLEEFLPSASYYQIQLVRLSRAEVLSMLRAVGLLPVIPAEPQLESKSESKPQTRPQPESTQPAIVELMASMAPKFWLTQACKDHPRREGENKRGWAKRLHGHMKTAPVSTVWDPETIRRRLNDKT